MHPTRIPVLSLVALILGGAFFALPARAESVFDSYFSGSSLNFELSDDSITDTAKFEAELSLRFRDKDFSAFVRGSNDRPFAFQVEPFELDKRGFTYRSGDWDFTGGDFSLVFARGMALNAVESRPVDRDAQLDGALVQGSMEDTNLTLFWGRHKSDSLEYYVTGVNTDNNGPADSVRGGRIEFKPGNAGIGVSLIDANMTRFGSPLSTAITELDGSLRAGDMTFYYETAWFNRPEEEEVESRDGRGQLAEILYAAGGYSLSGTWIRYHNAAFDYATAPSLKRTDIDDSQSHPDDETGWRVESRFSPPEWDGNSLRALYADTHGIIDKGRTFRDIFLEYATSQSGDWSGTLSYDHIRGRLLYYGSVKATDQNIRATVDGPFFLDGTFHFQLRYRNLNSEFENDDEWEMGLDWAASPELTVGIFRETSTRPIEPPPPGLFGIPTDSPGEWNSAFARYSPDPWNEFELFIGSQRGGFQCSGGVCAQLPPFKGLRFTYYRIL